MTITRRRRAGLAVVAATLGVAATASLVVAPSHAQAPGDSIVEQCQHALGYPARTPADLQWLLQCVSALTPPTTTPPPEPVPGDWPTAATTGVPTGTVLTPAAECTLRTPNQVIVGKVFNCEVNVYATGVVIRDSLIRGGEHWGVFVRGGGSATFERVTIQPSSGCNAAAAVTGSNFTARRVKILSWGDAYFVSGPNIVVEDSYAKMCAPKGTGAHSDGVQGYQAGANTVIRHNQFDLRCSDQTNNPADNACEVTSPIFWGDDSGNGLRVQNNLLRGGGHTIRIHAGSGHTVTDNVVDRSWIFSPAASNCPSIATWANNRVAKVSEAGVLTDVVPLGCM